MKLDWLLSNDYVCIHELCYLGYFAFKSSFLPYDFLRVLDLLLLVDVNPFIDAPFEGFLVFFDFSGIIVGFLFFLTVMFVIVLSILLPESINFPKEVCVGIRSPVTADFDLDLDFDLGSPDFLETDDLTLDGAPPERWEYFDMLSALIF